MGGHRTRLLVLMCTGYFLVLLDVTVVNVALPRIGSDLGTDVAALQWVVDGYAVALAALLLVGGTVGDRLGHRRVVLTGTTLFGVASLGCGLAPTPGTLVAARVLQGVGAALMLPGTLAIIGDAHPDPRERARAIGVWAGVGSVALPAGPLLGGLLVEGPGWRWVFLVAVPVTLVLGIATVRLVPPGEPRRDRRPDLAGTALGALFLVALVLGVVGAGHDGAGPVPALAGGVALLALVTFVLVERSVADPMLPLPLLRRPAFGVANAVAGAMNLGTLGLLFLLTLFLQTVLQRSPVAAGVAVLPLFLPLVALAPLVGRVVGRFGSRVPMSVGLVVAAAGVAAVATWSTSSGYPQLLAALLAWGVGIGVLTPAVVAAAVAAAPDRSGLASGVNNTARQAGGAIGIAVYGAVAGSPTDPSRFVTGLHHAAVGTAALFLVAAAASVVAIPGPGART